MAFRKRIVDAVKESRNDAAEVAPPASLPEHADAEVPYQANASHKPRPPNQPSSPSQRPRPHPILVHSLRSSSKGSEPATPDSTSSSPASPIGACHFEGTRVADQEVVPSSGLRRNALAETGILDRVQGKLPRPATASTKLQSTYSPPSALTSAIHSPLQEPVRSDSESEVPPPAGVFVKKKDKSDKPRRPQSADVSVRDNNGGAVDDLHSGGPIRVWSNNKPQLGATNSGSDDDDDAPPPPAGVYVRRCASTGSDRASQRPQSAINDRDHEGFCSSTSGLARNIRLHSQEVEGESNLGPRARLESPLTLPAGEYVRGGGNTSPGSARSQKLQSPIAATGTPSTPEHMRSGSSLGSTPGSTPTYGVRPGSSLSRADRGRPEPDQPPSPGVVRVRPAAGRDSLQPPSPSPGVLSEGACISTASREARQRSVSPEIMPRGALLSLGAQAADAGASLSPPILPGPKPFVRRSPLGGSTPGVATSPLQFHGSTCPQSPSGAGGGCAPEHFGASDFGASESFGLHEPLRRSQPLPHALEAVGAGAPSLGGHEELLKGHVLEGASSLGGHPELPLPMAPLRSLASMGRHSRPMSPLCALQPASSATR